MKKKQLDKERFKDVPRFDLIVENGTTHIDSVYMFKSANELFPFLYACQAMNSTVVFENENFFVTPDKHGTLETDVKLALYCSIAENPEFVEQYISYLIMEKRKEERAEAVRGQHEPILKDEEN